MTWRYGTIVALTGFATLACGGADQADEQPVQAAAQPDTATLAAAPAQPETETPAPTPAPTQPARTVASPFTDALEEPWFPTDTGTVEPGWTAEDVISVWGEPVTDRSSGVWTFLYFRNGCERACGTFDVVILERNQVVDAIVRGRGHTYAGISSSPQGRLAEFTPPTSTSDSSGVIG